MASTNRTGRVSSIDYEAGTYEVTYFDRGKSVTRKINAQSNGEYKMPKIGQVVSVSHTSNGISAGTTTGTVWNKTNKPAEGFKGLFRKEYGNTKGKAYERYDENTGVYTQFVDKRTGRNCNGEIYDEAKGPITIVAKKQAQIKSEDGSVSVQGKTGVGIVSEKTVSIESEASYSIQVGTDASENIGGNREFEITGEDKETYHNKVERNIDGLVTLKINGVTITIDKSGAVNFAGATKIEMTAPEINIKGGAGEIEIAGVRLTQCAHPGGISGGTTEP